MYENALFPDQKAKSIWDKDVKVEENGYYWHGTPIVRDMSFRPGRAPTVVELFSGCGGTSTGFRMAGYDIGLGLDIHKPSFETFSSNHKKSSAILGDVKQVPPELVQALVRGKADVLIAGIPCQGFSLNNRKRHSNDDRNFLYLELLKFIKILKPKIVVVENVSGLGSARNGDFIRLIEDGIAEAGRMKVSHALLNACDYGVPQRRKRLVFVGVRGKSAFNFGDIIATHGPEAELPYNTVHDAISDLPSLKSGNSSELYKRKPSSGFQKLMRQDAPPKLYNHSAPSHPLETIRKIARTKPGEPMYPNFKQRIRLAWDILSPTQVSGGIRPQFQFGHPEDARGLTIRERCRMQSFPDDFIVSGGIVQGRVQTGNAVPPLLAKAIATALKRYL